MRGDARRPAVVAACAILLLAACAGGGAKTRTPGEKTVVPTPSEAAFTVEAWPWDFETTVRDLTPFALGGIAGDPGAERTRAYSAWCLAQGIEDVRPADWPNPECVPAYLASEGIDQAAIDLLMEERLTVFAVRQEGPIAVTKAFRWTDYETNAWSDDYIVTPQGVFDLGYNYEVLREPVRDAIAAAERLPTFDAIRRAAGRFGPIDASMWEELDLGAPLPSRGGFEVPVEWALHTGCHACPSPYGAHGTLRFDGAGTPLGFEVDGFCSIPDWVSSPNWIPGFPSLDLRPCTLDVYSWLEFTEAHDAPAATGAVTVDVTVEEVGIAGTDAFASYLGTWFGLGDGQIAELEVRADGSISYATSSTGTRTEGTSVMYGSMLVLNPAEGEPGSVVLVRLSDGRAGLLFTTDDCPPTEVSCGDVLVPATAD